MYKVIIAGSRGFKDYGLLKKVCDYMLQNKHPDIEIVSGKAKGADDLGEKYAEERGYDVKPFPAPWDDIEGKPEHEIGDGVLGLYWKRAGFYRNELMAEYADALIAFDMGTSGTADMIKKAEKHELKIKVYKSNLRF